MKKIICLIIVIQVVVNTSNSQPVDPFPKISKRVQKTPKRLNTDLEGLCTYLVEKTYTEKEKAWAIYRWITLNIDYDKYAYKNGSRRINKTVEDILNREMAICFGYATLFKAMCDQIGLNSELIVGYSKGTLTSTPELKKPDHAWNAVQIDDEWALLDATWGSSLINAENDFVRQFKEGYFLTSPQNFIVNHLPIDPMWQLLDCPIGTSIYRQSPTQIQNHIANSEPCYNYQDSIRQFRTLARHNKKLQEGLNAYRFNPTDENRRELIQAYMDYASRLSDQSERFQNSGDLDSLILLQDQVLDACEKAGALGPLYNWQQELRISTLMNQAVALYQQAEDLDNSQAAANYKTAIIHLEKADELLQLLPESYFSGPAKQQCQQYLEVIRPLVIN